MKKKTKTPNNVCSLQPFGFLKKKKKKKKTGVDGKYIIMLLCVDNISGMIHKYVVSVNASKQSNWVAGREKDRS